MSPLTTTIRQAIALSGGMVEQMGGGCEVLRLPWGHDSFIRISSRDDTLVLPETLDGEPVSVGVYWNADDEDSLQEDLCCNFDSLREALLGTIPGTTVSILQPESARAWVALLPSDKPESEDEEEEELPGADAEGRLLDADGYPVVTYMVLDQFNTVIDTDMDEDYAKWQASTLSGAEVSADQILRVVACYLVPVR